jgi:hypothetical protein
MWNGIFGGLERLNPPSNSAWREIRPAGETTVIIWFAGYTAAGD